MGRWRTLLLLASAVSLALFALLARTWLPFAAAIVGLIWAYRVHKWISRQVADEIARYDDLSGQSFRAAPAGTAEFLATLESSLGLPAYITAEIRTELADHLTDSIASLEAEGLSREAAAREALARLGNPQDLARQLRAAHHSTRRLLVGVVGGFWAAGSGVAQTYLVMLAVGIVLTLAGGLAIARPLGLVAERLQLKIELGAAAYGLIPVAIAWGIAFVSARWAVQDSALLMHRTLRQVGTWWAFAGAMGLVLLLAFVVRAQQSWVMVAFELSVPVVFAAGALIGTGRKISIPRVPTRAWAIIAVVLLCGLTFTVATGGIVTTGESHLPEARPQQPYDPGARGFDRVAPSWSTDFSPLLGTYGFQYLPSNAQAGDESWDIYDAAAIVRYSDVRLEVWRATPFVANDPDGNPSVLPGETAPYVIAPAERSGESFRAHLDLSHVRNPYWLVFATATGPDGHRYRLAEPLWQQTVFTGTIWDWVTAAD